MFPGLDFLFFMEFGVDLDTIGTERFETVDGWTVVGVLLVGVLFAENA